MFLFMMIVIGCIVWVYALASDWKGEKDSKDRAMKNGRDWYKSRDGYYVDVNTDVKYKYERPWKMVHDKKNRQYHMVQGDLLKVSPRNGRVIENVTETRMYQRDVEAATRREIARQKGEKFYLHEEAARRSPMYQNYPGIDVNKLPRHNAIWGDTETGKLYMVTKNYNCVAYWNIYTKRTELVYFKKGETKQNILRYLNSVQYNISRNKNRVDWSDCKDSSSEGYFPDKFDYERPIVITEEDPEVIYDRWAKEDS